MNDIGYFNGNGNLVDEKVTLPKYITDKREVVLKTATPDPNNPGTFTVSEEEAERIRTIAMANSGKEMSPEMQKAMGIISDGDYAQKIPDKIHNYICYDEAKRKNEEYQKEADKFTNSVVPDNATKEILDEAEATTNLSEFDFGDISEYLNKLEELSFLEAVSYKKKVDAEIARWKSCASMLKAISELRLDDTTNRELMKVNAMEKYDFIQSIDDFESHYEGNLDKLNQISNKLISIVNSHKDEMDSTKFLTQEMIHLMRGKIEKLDPSDINYQLNRTKMETVINAFENRLDLTYLKNKFEIYLKTNKNNIKKDFRDNAAKLNGGRRSKVINDLIRFFSEDIVYAMYERLMYIFNDDTRVVYILFGFIAKVLNTEKKTSKDVWAKVFALNLSDIYNNIFDIDINKDGEDNYCEKIYKTFDPIVWNFTGNNRYVTALNFGITFGLKTAEKKKPDHFDTDNISVAPGEEATVF